jgi:hypothetical protein
MKPHEMRAIMDRLGILTTDELLAWADRVDTPAMTEGDADRLRILLDLPRRDPRTTNPIANLIDASVHCRRCGAQGFGTCDCYGECRWQGCTWWFYRDEECHNPIHWQPPLDVACPHCGAQPGRPCRTKPALPTWPDGVPMGERQDGSPWTAMTAERTVVIRGTLTDDDLREIVVTMQRIEERRSAETFSVTVDDPRDRGTVEGLDGRMSRLNPLRPGYRRTVEYAPTDELTLGDQV